MKMEIEDKTIEFHVLYGVRKKISIQIDHTGYMTVKAPNDTSQETIMSLIRQHGKQIVEKLQLIEKSKETIGTKEYQEEGKFLHLGKYHYLHELIETAGRSEEELKMSLKKFYFSSCKKIIADRIKIYQTQLKVKPKAIEIEESNTKWGSCSSDKN